MNSPAVATCKFCLQAFEYLAPAGERRRRTVCDPCRETRKKWLRKQWKQRQPRPARRAERAKPGEFRSRPAMARDLGLTLAQVRQAEDSALAKLRSSPQLQEAYAYYKEDGLPFLKELLAALQEAPPETTLLDRALELLGHWRVHDEVRARGLVADARALQAEIRAFHRLLGKEVMARRAAGKGNRGK